MIEKVDKSAVKKGNGRLVIVGVFAAFLAPVLIALLMQSSLWSYQPESSKAHGQLIKPVLELNQLKNILAERSKWWLLTIDNGNCNEICEKTLIELRQQRKAAGMYTNELALLYISSSTPNAITQKRISTIEPKIQQLTNPSLFASINKTNTESETGGQIWLLDRDLNLFMFYSSAHNSTGIRKDLKRILTWALEKPE